MNMVHCDKAKFGSFHFSLKYVFKLILANPGWLWNFGLIIWWAKGHNLHPTFIYKRIFQWVLNILMSWQCHCRTYVKLLPYFLRILTIEREVFSRVLAWMWILPCTGNPQGFWKKKFWMQISALPFIVSVKMLRSTFPSQKMLAFV